MKKLTSIFLIFILICTLSSCNVENTHNTPNDPLSDDPEAPRSGWKDAYLNFIERREREYDFDYRYALVYIDHDDIPELYAMGICEADGDLICSYQNDRIVEQRLGRMCGGKYVERSGMIINQNGHMGQYYDNVYRLDDNGFSQILNASHTEHCVPLENSELEMINEYFIDGKAVSKDEYHAAISATVDLAKTVDFYENVVSYDVIKQQIADCK